MFLEVLDGMEVKEGATEQSGEKFSIKRSTEGFDYVQIDRNVLDMSGNTKEAVAIAKVLEEQFHNIIKANGQVFRINATTNGEFRYSDYSKSLFNEKRQVYDDRIKSLENADEILMAATDWKEEKIRHKKFDHAARGFVYIKVDDRGYKAEVVVGLMNDGSATYYSLEKLKEKTIVEAPLSREPKRRPSSEETSTVNNIPQTGGNVNTESGKNSLRMADQTSPVTPYGRDTLSTFGEGKETAGGLAEAAQIQAGEIAERILSQSKYLNPFISQSLFPRSSFLSPSPDNAAAALPCGRAAVVWRGKENENNKQGNPCEEDVWVIL